MTPETVIDIMRSAVQAGGTIVAPVLLIGLATGVIVSVFQAATQINEMTLSFIPKLVAMAATLTLAGPWMLKLIVGYTRELFESIPGLVG